MSFPTFSVCFGKIVLEFQPICDYSVQISDHEPFVTLDKA